MKNSRVILYNESHPIYFCALLKIGQNLIIKSDKIFAVIKYNVFIFKNKIIFMDQTTQIKNSKTTFAGLS